MVFVANISPLFDAANNNEKVLKDLVDNYFHTSVRVESNVHVCFYSKYTKIRDFIKESLEMSYV